MNAKGRFAGRAALITGGASGLGRAVGIRLASDEASFITGAILPVDGGYLAAGP